MKRGASLKSWLRRYWLTVLVFCVIIYFLSQEYFLRRITADVENGLQKSIIIAEDYIEDSLEIVDSFIYDTFSNSTAMPGSQPFYLLTHGKDDLEISMAKNSVTSMLLNLNAWSEMVDGIIFYTQTDDGPLLLEAGSISNYTVRKELKAYVSEMFAEEFTVIPDRYILFFADDQNHMLRIMKLENCFFIVHVSREKILQTLKSAAYDEESIVFVVDEDGNEIFATSHLDTPILSGNEGGYILMNNKEYLQSGYVSQRTGYYFGMLTDKGSITEKMRDFRAAFMVLFLVLTVFIPTSVYVIHRILERPLNRIAEAMKQIEEGDLDVIVNEESQITEFSQLVNSFNHMMGRIRKLKIENYEMLLNTQKVTMQYLALQINPHFYANMLNVIYSLAQTKDYEKIQRLSVAIGNYSRYMFHDATELVELKREMEHVRDYMEMQAIRYEGQISCLEDISEDLGNALIPPFVIQSFVENSVKYGFCSKKGCLIRVSVHMDDSHSNLIITIRDNGKGYPKELLGRDWKYRREEGHIGLSNVYTRMKLIYEDGVDIRLYNDNGAVSVLTMPCIVVEDEGINDA